MQKAAKGSTYTRVAVVQLAYHPAIVVDRRSPLEDPLFDPRGASDSLLPSRGEVPEAIKPKLDALRKRIREAYDAQLLARVRAVLASCREYGARIAVLPEYSVPWELLDGVAEAAGDMVVVAGTHTVDRAARRSGVYERLGATSVPTIGQSVCPVLHGGKLLSLQAKLNPAIPERSSMRPGEAWAPVDMPDGIPGPMGVLVCLDFLFRESESYRRLVAGRLRDCRFLAVPSLTPHHTLPEFAGKAWEEARRYGRPVLYCDGAEGGGTSVVVDEGQAHDLRRFPDRAGYLEPGDEGVIVADVDLGYERAGSSTRYEAPRPVVPIAEATLVYRGHPAGEAYAQWLDGVRALLARDDDDALEAIVARLEQARDVLLNAGALSGAAARGRRLRRLYGELDRVTSVEEIRQFTREVVVPAEVLPLDALRAAMAGAAADAVFAWMAQREAREAGFAEVEARLRKAVDAKRGAGEWTSEGVAALGAVAQAVRGAPEVDEDGRDKRPAPEVRVVLPRGLDPAALGTKGVGGWILAFQRRPADLIEVVKDRLRRVAAADAEARRPVEELDEHGHVTRFSEQQINAAEDLRLLAVAEGRQRIATVGVSSEGQNVPPTILIASSRDEGWVLWTDGGEGSIGGRSEGLLAALAETGLAGASCDEVPSDARRDRIASLLPRFGGARAVIEAVRDQRLREVDGRFVEPDARVDGGEPTPMLGALDAWLSSGEPTALVLGEFGLGKSTALAVWADRRWESGATPLPLLVNLAGASPSASAEQLLLQAARLEDAPENRAAVRLLTRYRLLVPCFDGFDEMATRLEAAGLAGRLSGLLEIAAGGGKVLVSSRDNYFPSQAHLTTTTESALSQALGAPAGIRRVVVQPFTDDHVRDLVRQIRGEGGAAAALSRIAGIYDLKDLVHRPLLLGMVLATLDDLSPGAQVGRADLYEAYLKRWLDNTRKDDPECFTDEQKKEFAEALAEQLWRSGKATCTWQELQGSVRARLFPLLPEGMPPGAAFLEIQGGAFFVHESEDGYRFAHKSFLEYFLARSLVATLPERPEEALRTRPITQEVAAFVGEILRADGEPRRASAVRAVQSFLAEGRRPFQRPSEAAENALRLLLGLSRWAGDAADWIPGGADLRGAQLAGEDLRGARLLGAKLENANLAGADLSGADLTGAVLSEATMSGAKLDGTTLRSVLAHRADFTQVEANGAGIEAAELTGAIFRQSTWTGCFWQGARADGADVSAWMTAGENELLERGRSLAPVPPQVQAELVSGHTDIINVIAWAPDGKRLVSAGRDTMVHLWDADTGNELACLEGHSQGVFAVAWRPDSKRLATAGYDGTVRLWDADTGNELACLEGHSRWFFAVAWHPDGTRLASAGGDKTVSIWDARTGSKFARRKGHSASVTAIAWHPDGKRLATAGHYRSVRLWDADTGKELARLEGHSASVTAIAWQPDGKRLATAGRDGTVRLWDADTGKELARLEGHSASVTAIAWHPDGKRLATAGYDRSVCLWDADTGKELARLEGHSASVTAIAWHPDGKRLATAGDDGTVRLWDADTGKELARLEGHQREISAVAWHPGGKRLASAGYDTAVHLWDADTDNDLARLGGYSASVRAVAWHPDGKRLATAGYDGTVRLWSADTGKTLARLDGHSASVRAVAWHPDGKRLATAGHDGTVRLWDADTGNELARLEGHSVSVRAVAWHPDGKCLASAGDDTMVRLWDADTGEELARLEGHSASVRAVAWHPDGKCLATAGYDGTVRLWGADTGKTLVRSMGHSASFRAVAWHPDGKCLATAVHAGTVHVWDADTGNELARAVGHSHSVRTLAWHPDGKRLASAGDDRTVRLWAPDTGNELARLEGHSSRIWAIAWHPDGKRLASAGDHSVRIWNAFDGKLLASFESVGFATLARTAGGFCSFGDLHPDRARLALRRPDATTTLYLPLAGFRDVLHRPDKVKAALSGDLSGDDLGEELARHGYAGGVPWDGEAHIIKAGPAALGPTAAVPATAGPAPAPTAPALAAAAPAAAALAPAPTHAPAIRELSLESLSLPAGPLPNPFRPGPALTDASALPGRAPVLAELLALIDSRSPAVLRGPRRSGKTSILHHLAARLSPTRAVHHRSLEGRASPLRTADDLAVFLEPSLQSDATPALTLRNRLSSAGNAVLLLDEVANLHQADATVFAWLRAVGQERTSVVLVGSHWDWVTIVEHAFAAAPGSSFGNDVTPVNLGPLAESDAIRFLVDTAPPDVPVEAERTARWIVELCGPWPFYLQVMGYALVQAVRAGQRRALVERAGVRELYEQRLLLDRDAAFFGARWAELPERARAVLRALRSAPDAALPEVRRLPSEDFALLCDAGLCDALGAWLADPPFFDWIRRVAREPRREP
ncbi:pentapeptide repeat-containing protein [Sorangium sp. So ce375]|uniref:WD40 domain-containing protein n=1 Tax=Sorangium sp. So ce375 TaxID=3133306 RepID=UPI003F5C4A9B